MQILVLVKPAPDPEKHNETETALILSQADRSALQTACQLRAEGDTITVLSMAPDAAKSRMTECLALGADKAVLVSDKAFAGADTYATSFVLAETIKYMEEKFLGETHAAEEDAEESGEVGGTSAGFDIILAGNESPDGGTSNIPAQIAQRLQWPCLSSAVSILRNAPSQTAELHNTPSQGIGSQDAKPLQNEPAEITVTVRDDSGVLTYEGRLPAVIAMCRDAAPRKPATAMEIIKARKKPIVILTNEDLGLPSEQIGLAGSKTKMGNLYDLGMKRSAEKLGETPLEAAEGILALIRKAGA